MLNRIAVTNPSTKITPNMQVTGPVWVAIIEHSQNAALMATARHMTESCERIKTSYVQCAV
jgi:hypothetical protein